MREILFRAKRRDNGEWVEGAYCPKSCDNPFGPMVDRPSIINLVPPFDGLWFDVDPETVGQYTGCFDRNGEKIFEGDIVAGGDYNIEDGYGEVRWDDAAWEITNLYLSGSFHDNYHSREFEVIGNIYDNPELRGQA